MNILINTSSRYVTLLGWLLAVMGMPGCGSNNAGRPDDQNQSATVLDSLPVNQVYALGRMEPEHEIVPLAIATDGVVEKQLVGPGDSVVAGTLLLTLASDVEEAKAAQAQQIVFTRQAQVRESEAVLAQARSQYASRRQRFARSLRLYQVRSETAQQLEDDSADAEQARLEVERLSAQCQVSRSQYEEALRARTVAGAELALRRVKAPADGVLLQWNVKPGAAVQRGASFADYAPAGDLVVRAEVDELFAGQVAVGQPVSIRLLGAEHPVAAGEVSYVGSYLENKSLFAATPEEQEDRRVRRVKVRLNQPGGLLLNTRVECVIQTSPSSAARPALRPPYPGYHAGLRN
jgi:multidrug resistance efflux pump